MTIWLDIPTNPDGSPTGKATIKACNPSGGASISTRGQLDVEFTDDFQHVKSALGSMLERVEQAEANQDPEG